MEVVVQLAFGEIAALLMLASVVGFLGWVLRQPLIVSFISELAGALLLFLVGRLGISETGGLSCSPHGRADQRVLPDLRRHGRNLGARPGGKNVDRR
ncbi:hypothetical protein [Rhodopseudomonas palustris]|uniref:hypothetical protein n=1 Tax=Rhodopseudomonas palustris TaxID=1076 RepID=UPI0005A0909A